MKANSLGSLATAEEILPSVPFFIHTWKKFWHSKVSDY